MQGDLLRFAFFNLLVLEPLFTAQIKHFLSKLRWLLWKWSDCVCVLWFVCRQ